ncbi:MAG: hypothetical protein JRF57_02200 [Deltaproteobacteria bacterium]|nr:hypothetical protein [Deltaproteobacteria bacterium]
MGISRICSPFFWPCFLFVILASSPVYSNPALLLPVDGRVDVIRHGMPVPARTGTRLQSGMIVASQGGRATILLSDGTVLPVDAGRQVIVPEGEEAGGVDGMVTALMDTVREMTSRGSRSISRAAEADAGKIFLLYPCDSNLLPGELRFEWKGPVGLEDVEVSIRSPSPPFQHVFTPSVKEGDGEKGLPPGFPPLLPETRYYWKVKGFLRDENRVISSRFSWFAIAGERTAQALDMELKRLDRMDPLDEKDRIFLKAALYLSYGLNHKGLVLLRMLHERVPKDTGLKEIITGVLQKIKMEEGIDVDH